MNMLLLYYYFNFQFFVPIYVEGRIIANQYTRIFT